VLGRVRTGFFQSFALNFNGLAHLEKTRGPLGPAVPRFMGKGGGEVKESEPVAAAARG